MAANDPDLGLVETAYNSLSELISQQSPRLRNQSSSLVQAFSYDLLGRVVQRTEPSDDLSGTLTTSWSYDSTTGGNAGIGKLTQETISGGTQPAFTRNYSYGGASGGRLSQLSTTIGTETFLTGHSYDALGRPDEITYPASPSYPTGLVVEHTYNPRGYLERLSNTSSGQVYYQVLDVNARGQIEQEYRGDHSTTTLTFIANTGRLQSTSATRPFGSGQETLQSFSYSYDSLGNMLSRSDLLQNLSESFTFDEQNRLTSATVEQGSTTLAITDFAFDDLGNLTHKSDITSLGSGSLVYAMLGNAGPHAVTSLNTGSGSVNFSYDANGNLTSGDAGNTGRTIAWSAYDKPVEITQGAISRTFAYGPDRQRYQQVHDDGSGPTTTTYVGDYYTRIDAGGGNELHKLYLYANGRVMAIVEDDADTGIGSTSTRYLHRDHLGSITLIVDDSGVERLSYDAWGQRRDATDWVGAPTATPTEVRGYTGHEHLDDVNLIHMNGRIYDPQLGRMVSGDPILQDPLNSQSFNRYSYVWNNPLKYTDPSGFLTYMDVYADDVYYGDEYDGYGTSCETSYDPIGCMIQFLGPMECWWGGSCSYDTHYGDGGGGDGRSGAGEESASNDASQAQESEKSQHVDEKKDDDDSGKTKKNEKDPRTDVENGSRQNHKVVAKTEKLPPVQAINGGGLPSNNGEILLTGHKVMGTAQHTAIQVTTRDGAVTTLSAGPASLFDDTLVSDINRLSDEPSKNYVIGIITPPENLTVEQYLDVLISTDYNYCDCARYNTFPDAFGGYNSNSYVSGLLEATGGTVNVDLGEFYGGNDPLPKYFFEGGP